MSEMIREESSSIKALVKNAPDRDWTQLITSLENQKIEALSKRSNVEKLLKVKSNNLQSLKIAIATHKDRDVVTQFDVSEKDGQIKKINLELSNINIEIADTERSISEGKTNLEKIDIIKNQFPIVELENKLKDQNILKDSLIDLGHQLEKEKTLLTNQKNSLKKLVEVPCGDQFPKCKFIKDSYLNKDLIPDQEEKVKTIKKAILSIRQSLDVVEKEKLHEKIEKYGEILKKQSELGIKIANQEIRFNNIYSTKERLTSILQKSKNELQDMRLRVSGEDVSGEILKIRKKELDLETAIKKLDTKRISLTEQTGRLINELRKTKSEFDQYKEMKDKWRIYEILSQAFSKKGIPLQVIMSQLPAINSEISKILQDTAGFTVELDADLDSNAMDVYINYGDSRRIIELASGMEKMMASLAIRVALINVSTLPKTDILIIDEGFGSLDETNIDNCNRLLESFKKWFKHILIISHVDAVKDVVDNVIDINKKGKDSVVFHA